MSEGLRAVAKASTLRLQACALAAAELGILLAPAPIRVASGLTLYLILPGLAIMRVIRFRTRIEGTERLLLVPGVSVAIVVITGLLLNTAHIRLTTTNWAIALGVVTAAGLLAGAKLEDAHEVRPQSRRPRAWQTTASAGGRRSLGIGLAAVLAVAALAVSGAVVIGVLGQRDRDRESAFTELWALPGPRSGSAIRLGVRSYERGDVHYRIRVSIEGRVVRSQPLMLRPGQTWHSSQPAAKRGERVDVTLLASARGPVYREVHLTAG
jgi:uncharacterized membrane protein